MGSAAEAEFGALLHTGQEARPIHATLQKMVHTQPETPMETGNSVAHFIVNNTVHQKYQNPWICTFIGLYI